MSDMGESAGADQTAESLRDRAVVNEDAEGASSPSGLPSLSEVEQDPGIKIHWLGGNCPVQAEGEIDGEKFYFRARGQHWSVGIGGADEVLDPCWFYDEPYGDEEYAAGWMETEEARIFIGKAARLFRESDQNPKGGDGEAGSVHADPVPEGNSPEILSLRSLPETATEAPGRPEASEPTTAPKS